MSDLPEPPAESSPDTTRAPEVEYTGLVGLLVNGLRVVFLSAFAVVLALPKMIISNIISSVTGGKRDTDEEDGR